MCGRDCGGVLFAILQATVAPEMQGRVFMLVNSATSLMTTVGLVLAGVIGALSLTMLAMEGEGKRQPVGVAVPARHDDSAAYLRVGASLLQAYNKGPKSSHCYPATAPGDNNPSGVRPVMMDLLERETYLEALTGALSQTASGGGQIVLVTGEAGIGKTSLVEHFLDECDGSARVLVGVCDALFAPRPLGPLHDIALQLGGRLLELISQQADRLAIFTAFLEALQSSSAPAVVVIEDIHWADESTLDLLKFLGRRIQRTHTLLIATYRDDEVGSQHPLWFLLGDLPAQYTMRLELSPLSERAVSELARQAGRNVTGLYRVTGGNPFFVTEVLAGESAHIPPSVRQAVLGRVARLAAPARELLDLASVVPTRAERWLLEAVLSPSVATLEECASSGLVRLEHDAVVFRHDLARQAIQETMPAPRARVWHAAVLQALLSREESPLARIVHHARAAGDDATVVQVAPRAAEQASTLGAHREAVSHYDAALRAATTLSPVEQAQLLEKRAYEYYLTGEIENAAADRQAALAIWQSEQRQDKEGENLRWLSRLAWFQGKRAAAERYTDQAIAVLEALPPGRELAMTYSNRAQLYMLSGETEAATSWGQRAIELAEAFGDTEIVVHALNNVGTGLLESGDEAGRSPLVSSLQQALAHDMQEHVARAYTNLGAVSVTSRDYARAATYLNQGIAYCEERDLDSWSLYMRGWRARARLEQGQWSGAIADASVVLKARQGAAILRLPALIALGTVYVRRGDAGTRAVLDEALKLALETDELQRIAPVAAACAEAAWWQGQPGQVVEAATNAFNLACERGTSWEIGNLAVWLWRAGALDAPPPQAAEPYRLQMLGDWRQAAAIWEQLGCPYEQALALIGGDAQAQKEALAILDTLGAAPAADWLRQQLRSQGVRGIPQTPRPETAANPAGLTPRQWEVLALLVEGLGDKEIGERLFISAKTAGHHVSAILARLDVASRQEAAIMAVQAGWFSAETP
jgi:DNA-binding CsgD family transcriptional regulator/tetratricopeptide (TPR) repeat protein